MTSDDFVLKFLLLIGYLHHKGEEVINLKLDDFEIQPTTPEHADMSFIMPVTLYDAFELAHQLWDKTPEDRRIELVPVKKLKEFYVALYCKGNVLYSLILQDCVQPEHRDLIFEINPSSFLPIEISLERRLKQSELSKLVSVLSMTPDDVDTVFPSGVPVKLCE